MCYFEMGEEDGFRSGNEVVMTDWDEIVTNIQNAMLAVDKAHEAGNNLRNHASADTIDEFKTHMENLYAHLNDLTKILDHISTYSMDELVDVLSQMYSGKPAAYRRTRHIEQ